MTYEGWKNRSTWNVSLWLNNEYSIYTEAVEFMKDYKGKRPYLDFCKDSGLDTQRTNDNIKWVSGELDYDELDSMMRELVEDLSPCTKCERKVEETTLTPYLDWKLCEDCAGEM